MLHLVLIRTKIESSLTLADDSKSMKTKGQHFLLSAKARSLSLVDIFRLSDADAFELFRQARWPETNGQPVCPQCGSVHAYWIASRQQWRCKVCKHTFSVTSGTLFAYHKLPIRIYLAAIALYSNTAKGLSALQLCRDLDVQYKTAFVMMHKIRESLLAYEDVTLSGEVEIDGAAVNHYVRPENKKEERKDLRLAVNQNPNKRCVMVLRQRGAQGADKTLSFVARSENHSAVLALAKKFLEPKTTVFADENSAYDILHAHFRTLRVNHALLYSGALGENTNQAESYFARFRRMHIGQVHRMGNLYLHNYANEVAYREDTRRWSNGGIFADITSRCARSPVSRDFCGYWQGNKRLVERLVA